MLYTSWEMDEELGLKPSVLCRKEATWLSPHARLEISVSSHFPSVLSNSPASLVLMDTSAPSGRSLPSRPRTLICRETGVGLISHFLNIMYLFSCGLENMYN